MNQQIYSQATLMIRLSSTAPPENHGFVARHDSSAPSFSAVTRSVSMLDVRFASCQEKKMYEESQPQDRQRILHCCRCVQ